MGKSERNQKKSSNGTFQYTLNGIQLFVKKCVGENTDSTISTPVFSPTLAKKCVGEKMCPRKGRRGGIRTCDLRFIKRDSQPIELPLRDNTSVLMLYWKVLRDLESICYEEQKKMKQRSEPDLQSHASVLWKLNLFM
jgi:hypothetical protein